MPLRSEQLPYGLDQLRIFMAVAETGHFSRAADSMGLTQSAVSQQIGKLETAIGQSLFERTTRRVSLTPAGSTLLVYARAMVGMADQALRHFSHWPSEGVLRLGIVSDFASTQLYRVLRMFRQQYPRFALSVTSSTSMPLLHALEAAELDLVLVKIPPQHADGYPFWRDQLVWVGDPASIGPMGDPIPLVVYAEPSPSRTLILDALRKAGETWHVVAESTALTGLVAGIKSGLGVAAFGGRSVRPAGLVEINHPRLPMLGELEYSILLSRPPRHEAVDAFAAMLRSIAVAMHDEQDPESFADRASTIE